MLKVMTCLLIALAIGFGQYLLPDREGQNDIRLAPKLMNYQGFMTDTLNNPITDSLDILFRIYDAASAGNLIWSETQYEVPIIKGIFHVLLGTVTAIPDSVFTKSADRWLELRISSQNLSPRTRFTAAPYAYTADYADTAIYARNAANDNDWKRTDGKLYTYNLTDSVGIRTSTPRYALDVNGVICGGTSDTVLAAYGAVLGGYSNKAGNAAVDTGATVAGGYDNTAVNRFSFVGGGLGNSSSGNYSLAVGGRSNIASSDLATVSGGYANSATGYTSVVVGGHQNEASGNYAMNGGGFQNNAVGMYSVVTGGQNNRDSANYGVIAGGYSNKILTSTTSGTIGGGNGNVVANGYGVIAGGYLNTAKGTYAAIAGGANNQADTQYTAVGGGYSNAAYGNASVVAGGYDNSAGNNNADTSCVVGGGGYNIADGYYATVGGGRKNLAWGNKATVCGGDSNRVEGFSYATICGGMHNRVAQTYGFIGGGLNNQITNTLAVVGGGDSNIGAGNGSVIGGGRFNENYGYRATIGGGYANDIDSLSYYATISGGYQNNIKGYGSMIPGGYLNVVWPWAPESSANFAFAAGYRAKSWNDGCFTWGDSTSADLNNTVRNRWMARCCGGVYFYTNATLTSGVYVAAGGNSWSSVSDRNLKENFQDVDGAEVLNKLATMPITTWNYKSQDKSIRHIGPMAQDFAAFGVGEDDTHITTMDADGIALVAIQELYKQNQELKQEIEALKQELGKR